MCWDTDNELIVFLEIWVKVVKAKSYTYIVIVKHLHKIQTYLQVWAFGALQNTWGPIYFALLGIEFSGLAFQGGSIIQSGKNEKTAEKSWVTKVHL